MGIKTNRLVRLELSNTSDRCTTIYDYGGFLGCHDFWVIFLQFFLNPEKRFVVLLLGESLNFICILLHDQRESGQCWDCIKYCSTRLSGGNEPTLKK